MTSAAGSGEEFRDGERRRIGLPPRRGETIDADRPASGITYEFCAPLAPLVDVPAQRELPHRTSPLSLRTVLQLAGMSPRNDTTRNPRECRSTKTGRDAHNVRC